MTKIKDEVQTEVSAEVTPGTISTVKKLEKSFGKLTNVFKKSGKEAEKSEKSFVDFFAKFGLFAQGIDAAVGSVTRLTGALVDLGKRGGSAIAVQQTFDSLASPTTLANLQKATEGMLTNVELQREYVRIVRAGYATSEEDITKFYATIARGARQSGRDVKQSFEKLGDALTSGETSAFEDLGVNIYKIEEALEATGVEVDTASGKALVMKKAMEELASKTGNASGEVDNFGRSLTTTTTALQNYIDDVSKAFVESENMIGTMNALSGTFTGTGNEAKATGDLIGTAVEEMTKSIIVFFGATNVVFGGLKKSLAGFGLMYLDVKNAIQGGDDLVTQKQIQTMLEWGQSSDQAAQDMAKLYLEIEKQVDIAARLKSERGDSRFVGPLPGPEDRTPTRRQGGGAGPEFEMLDEGQTQREGIASQYSEDLLMLQELMGVIDERQASMIANNQALFDSVASQKDGEIRAQEKLLELQEQYNEKVEEQKQKQQENIQGTLGAMEQFGGAVQGVLSKVGAAQDENTKKAETYKKVQGGIFAAISFVRAAMEIAEVPAAFPNVVEMVSHGISAAAHIAAGVMALTELGGSGSPPANTAAKFTPKPKEAIEEGPKSGGGSQVVIYTMATSSARLGRELQNSSREMNKAGLEPDMAGAGAFGS